MASNLPDRILVRWERVAVAEPLVRALVVELTGEDPGPLHHSCPFCGSIEHGRPYVAAPVHVSIAHASDITVVAVSDLGPVGVDLEPGDQHAWARHEAIGKARGIGIVGIPAVAGEPLHEAQIDVPGHTAIVVVLNERAAVAKPVGAARRRRAH